MALSYTQKTSDNSLITKYLRNRCPTSSPVVTHTTCGQESLYDQFGTYLVQNGFYIADQLSSDSYAGELGNQTNLAVKSIIATKAASEIFRILGDDDKSQQYDMRSLILLYD